MYFKGFIRDLRDKIIMIYDIFMFVLSFIMIEGKIVFWIKFFGDKVEKGEIVLVVELDKVDMDVEFFNEGYLVVILVLVGEEVFVGVIFGLVVEMEVEIVEV